MHDAMVGLAFWGMILVPCLVAMKTRPRAEEDERD
jgi:hypothetical protein